MKGFAAFLKKEIREMIRTRKLMILLLVFLAFGILNPLTALLMPKLLQSAEIPGMTVGEITVTALDAWTQFAKNMPTAMIVFLISVSGIYTAEYTKGTLIPLLTKGLSRSAAVLAKCTVMLAAWSAGFWLCFLVTWFYSGWYWDNSAVREILFAAFCRWLFGVLMIACTVFFSSFAASAAQVILGTGSVYIAMTLIGMYDKANSYLPVHLCDSLPLYTGAAQPSGYAAAAAVTALLSAVQILAALPLTNRRQL